MHHLLARLQRDHPPHSLHLLQEQTYSPSRSHTLGHGLNGRYLPPRDDKVMAHDEQLLMALVTHPLF